MGILVENVNTRKMSSTTAPQQTRVKHSQFKQKFKQQRLPAWQPILTADTVLPAFFLIGLLFIPLGVALLYFSENVQEFQLDYTDCKQSNAPLNESLATSGPRRCADVIQDKGNPKCTCEIPFNLETAMTKNVYMYYGLDNFYQNHRRYVKSRDDKQLRGDSISALSSDCSPFDKDDKEKKIAPCGAIANSMFNDTLRLKISGGSEVGLLKTGIAWPSDKQIKFKNPPGSFDPSDEENFAFSGYTKPLYWSKPVWELDTETENNTNNGYQNEDLIVWMRTAAFPSFRKLYRRINHENEYFKYSLPASTYTLLVEYNYPVTQFNGAKRMILSTTSFLGGKNNFLGIAYIAVGSICLLLGVVFLIIHIKFGKRAADLNINQSTPYSD